MNPLSSQLEQLARRDARSILATTVDHYGDKVALAMSFQVGGCVLLDMLHRMDKRVQVFSLDTGRLPEETYECAQRIARRYGINVRWVHPNHDAVEKLIREKGVFSFKESVENRKECCGIRKVEPLARALAPFDAWITGRRLEQSENRRQLKVIEPDHLHLGKFKINPLAEWRIGDLWHYARKHNVPYNRLYDEGYLSIGCECCTRPCKGDEDERAGRWWWESEEHKECGLHLTFRNGAGI